MVRTPLIRNPVGGILVRVARVRSRFPSVLLQRSGAAAPHPVQRRMITGGDSGCRERGFKACPQDRGAPTVVAIEVLLKGFAGRATTIICSCGDSQHDLAYRRSPTVVAEWLALL